MKDPKTFLELPPMEGKPMRRPSRFLDPIAIAHFIIDVCTEERPPPKPPSANKSQLLRLITIPNSHFCEKARWALDLAQKDDTNPYYYVEDTHPLAFHGLYCLTATGEKQSHCPIVVYPDGRPPVCSSEAIVKQFCPHLYPDEIADDILKAELDFGQNLAVPIRYVFNCSPLVVCNDNHKYYPSLIEMCTSGTGVTSIERILFGAMFDKGIDKGMLRSMNLRAENYHAMKQHVRDMFHKLSQRVQTMEPGDYWMDTRTKKYGLTAADLCLATFVCTVCACPELSEIGAGLVWTKGGVNQENVFLPPDLIALQKELNETAVADYARRIYAQHRPVGPNGKIVILPARRDAHVLRKYWPLTSAVAITTIAAAAAVVVSIAFRKQRNL